jgi:hypothetical protein
MALRSVGPDDREHWPKLRRWWFGWRKKTGTGGYRRIQGALSNLGHLLAPNTIAKILKQYGFEPASERSRKTTWKEFLSRHWEQIVASDFLTMEVWTKNGLQRFVVVFFMELATRRVELGGIASVANGLWMAQIAPNLTDDVDGFFKGKRYLIHDRDPLYTGVCFSRSAAPPPICSIAAMISRYQPSRLNGAETTTILLTKSGYRIAKRKATAPPIE